MITLCLFLRSFRKKTKAAQQIGVRLTHICCAALIPAFLRFSRMQGYIKLTYFLSSSFISSNSASTALSSSGRCEEEAPA